MSNLPKFPIGLTFDPEKSVKLAPVIAVPVAWRLWLLWKPRHCVSDTFDSECISFGTAFEDGKILDFEDARRHFAWMGGHSNFHGNDLASFMAEAWPYLTGERPIETEQATPNN